VKGKNKKGNLSQAKKLNEKLNQKRKIKAGK
jgi:hypothetical protein